jgi:hypothetical protein
MIEPAVLEDAHRLPLAFRASLNSSPLVTSVAWHSQVGDLRGLPGVRLAGPLGFAAPPQPGCDSMNAVMSPSLFRIVVPFTRRSEHPMFRRRSFCRTFTLHPRIAA